MKKIILALLFSLAAVSFSMAEEGAWMDNFDAAKAKATKESKPILILFTGSDWCGWCIKLEKEVLSQKAFQDYAKENLVLMLVDFPQKKKQSDELKKQNEMLETDYKIEGYPTMYLLDAEGKKISKEFGYRPDGAEAYVEFLKGLLKK